MTTRTGLGWGNASPFQVTLYRKIVGDTNALASGTKRKGSGTYTLISNAITTPDYQPHKPLSGLINIRSKAHQKTHRKPNTHRKQPKTHHHRSIMA